MATTFSAVILAGGKSSRMGRDKAFLEFGGEPLLSRQISLVKEAGASEVFISGRPSIDYSALKYPVLLDESIGMGPLGGIASAFQAIQHPFLLVLAVDMPHITADFLKILWGECREGMGAVPKCGEIVEPLAAFYPKSASPLVHGLMAESSHIAAPGAKALAERCTHSGIACTVPVQPHQFHFFKSLNSPADLSS